MSEAFDLLENGLPFFERYAPWALQEGEGTAEDLGEWVEEQDKE